LAGKSIGVVVRVIVGLVVGYIMFKVAFRKCVGRSLWGTQLVCVDSLPEAEIMAVKILGKHIQGKKLMLLHKGDLLYDVYAVDKPIGEVAISTA
jgi:hypothetical protein